MCPYLDIANTKCGLCTQSHWNTLVALGMALSMVKTLCTTLEWPECGVYKMMKKEGKVQFSNAFFVEFHYLKQLNSKEV